MLELAAGDSVARGLGVDPGTAPNLLELVRQGLPHATHSERWTLIPIATIEQSPAQKIQVGCELDQKPNDPDAPNQLTLYSLVEAVGEITTDDREVVAAVSHILHSGRARLSAQFEGQRPNINITGP